MNNVTQNQTESTTTIEEPKTRLDLFLVETLEVLLEEVHDLALASDTGDELFRAWGRVQRVRGLRTAVVELAEREQAQASGAVYLASAAFLRGAFRELTARATESILYATGPDDGKGLFALTRLVRFKLARKGWAHASADPTSQVEVLTELDNRGERLMAVFHSHPGNGEGATNPSHIDLKTQRSFEQLGYPIVGAVFSRDGYVRFYSADRAFRIEVSGTGCERLGDRLFRVEPPSRRGLFRKEVTDALP